MGATPKPGSSGAGSGAYTRLLGAFAALGAGATAVVVCVLVVRGLPPIASSASTSAAGSNAASSATTPAPAAPTGFPVPPRGAVVFGAEAGHNALGLAVVPANGEIGLQASVVPENQGTTYPGSVKNVAVSFAVRGAEGQKATAGGAACGNGCFNTTVNVRRPLTVTIQLRGEELVQEKKTTKWTRFENRVSFAMPATWPPPSGANIIQAAAAAWHQLSTLTDDDRLGDGDIVLRTEWKYVAPDRLEYTIANGRGAGIIIGNRRWDKTSGSTRWISSAQYPIQQPTPLWQSATDAHLLGTVMLGGHPAWKVSFFDLKGGPAWFTILVDKATLHTMEAWMTADAHFMHETYSAFDAPITITPPKN